jgi:hypothetical protein
MIDPPHSVAKLKVLRVNLYVGLSSCPCAIRYLLQILFSLSLFFRFSMKSPGATALHQTFRHFPTLHLRFCKYG